MELSGFRVSVCSNGEELKEYSVEFSPDGRKVTCWVPSQSGKEFVVKYEIEESSVMKGWAKSVNVYLDGRNMRSHSSFPRATRGTFDGVRTSEHTIRPFIFADIQTTDEDTLVDDARANSDEIGTISVRVFLAESWKSRESSSRKYRIQDHPPAVINERKKKATEHCVSLGDERPSRSKGRTSMVYDRQNPDLVFEFRYRSKAMLQASGIIPPPKREAPLIIDVEDEDIVPLPKRQKGEHNEDHMRSMQSELDRLRRRVGQLEGMKGGPSGVKKEVVKCDPADIIDLT